MKVLITALMVFVIGFVAVQVVLKGDQEKVGVPEMTEKQPVKIEKHEDLEFTIKTNIKLPEDHNNKVLGEIKKPETQVYEAEAVFVENTGE